MNQRQEITMRFCELQLVIVKSKKFPASLVEEINTVCRTAWEHQISPDDLHLASLRYQQAHGIGITDAQILDHVATPGDSGYPLDINFGQSLPEVKLGCFQSAN